MVHGITHICIPNSNIYSFMYEKSGGKHTRTHTCAVLTQAFEKMYIRLQEGKPNHLPCTRRMQGSIQNTHICTIQTYKLYVHICTQTCMSIYLRMKSCTLANEYTCGSMHTLSLRTHAQRGSLHLEGDDLRQVVQERWISAQDVCQLAVNTHTTA